MHVDPKGRLSSAYREVGERTWELRDFSPADLEKSRSLFTAESLAARRPVPKALEVVALLSGIPFPEHFVQRLMDVQRRIGAVVSGAMHYWVQPANFGLEYCVFKWPEDEWCVERTSSVKIALSGLAAPEFRYAVRGIQVNPDGCVVAKGFDDDGVVFGVRQRVRELIPQLPVRQSGWAHVPLGRLLEPLGSARFEALRELMASLRDEPIAEVLVDRLSLVHETQWYMETKAMIAHYPLARRTP